MAQPLPKSITDRYKVKTEKNVYILECKKCGQKYSLDHTKPIKVGNTLALLNHSIGHDVTREDDE
jgi:Zn ribbon nucleic-acid-binding protein